MKKAQEKVDHFWVLTIAVITMLNASTISLYLFFTTSLFIVGIYLTKTIRVKKVNNLLKVKWLISATPNSDFKGSTYFWLTIWKFSLSRFYLFFHNNAFLIWAIITYITCIDFNDVAIRYLYSLANSFPFYVVIDLLFVMYARW